MRDNKVIGVGAGIIVLGSFVAIGLCLSGGFGPSLDAALYREVGRALARQTVALFKPGGRVTVITRDTGFFQNPATDIQFATFGKELAKQGLKIDSLQALQIDPLRPVAVPAGDFFQWIKNSTRGSVIVSFMGPPVLTEAQLAQLGEIKPSIIAFCSGAARDQVDLPSLFSRGLLQAAVVNKRPIITKSNRPSGDREAFDRQFIEVTPANLAILSAASTAPP